MHNKLRYEHYFRYTVNQDEPFGGLFLLMQFALFIWQVNNMYKRNDLYKRFLTM